MFDYYNLSVDHKVLALLRPSRRRAEIWDAVEEVRLDRVLTPKQRVLARHLGVESEERRGYGWRDSHAQGDLAT